MDFESIDQRLESGEDLKIKYRYPLAEGADTWGLQYGVRSDKLVDVSVERKRFYTNFRGEIPIWLENHEVIEIVPDDGVYQEFSGE